MTLTNYSTNKFSAAFNKNIKRHSLGAIAAIIISLLVSFGLLSIQLSLYKDNISEPHADITTETVIIPSIMTIIGGLYSLFASVRLFNEIYSKRACDFYFASPIKRSEYFNANMLFGVIVNAAIIVLPTVFYMLGARLQNVIKCVFEFDYKIVFVNTAALLMAVLAAYSVLMMCAVSSGKKIHYVILAYICILSAPTAISGVVNCINSIWGMNVNTTAFSALSPATNAISVFSHMNEIKTVLVLFAVSFVEFVITYVAGFVVFKNRKAEIAEVSLCGRIIPYIFLSIIAAAAFMYLSFASDFWVVAVTGSILAVLVTLVFTLIFYKRPFTKQTGITCAAVCAVCLCFMFFVYFPNYTGYVSYVPETEEIESVSVSNGSLSAYYGRNSLFSVMESMMGADDLIYEPIVFKSESGINSIRKLHNKIVEDETIKASKIEIDNLSSVIYGFADFEEYDVQIVYNLKNGKTVKRTYSVNAAYVFNEFMEAFKSEEALSQSSPFNINTEKIAFVELEYYNDDYLETNILQFDDYNEFLSLLLKDRLSESNENFIMDTDFGMPYYPETNNTEEYEDYDYKDNGGAYYGITFYVKKDNISAETEQKLNNMTLTQMKEYFDSIYYSDVLSDSQLPFEIYYENVEAHNENAFEYLLMLTAVG